MPNSRRKGHDFERTVAALLRDVWPETKRGLSQTRDGAEVPDCDGTPFWIECKADEKMPIERAMDQAREATDGRPPVVVSKKNRRGVLVTMTLHDWLAMARDSVILEPEPRAEPRSLCQADGHAEESE